MSFFRGCSTIIKLERLFKKWRNNKIMKKQNLINENKTFTFKYDPTISLEGTFFRMNEAMRTGRSDIQKDCSIVNSIEAIYRSMTKDRLKLFQVWLTNSLNLFTNWHNY